MQETVIILCYHRTSVHTHTCYFQSCPYRVTGEQLVVRSDSCEFYHTEFHNHMIDQFLSFFFSQDACCNIFLNINIKESRNTSDTHSCTVLCLDGSQISEVQPLNCFFCILSRLGNIISIGLCHFFHFLQCTNLVCNLFTQLEVTTTHTLTVCSSKICFLFLDQVIDTVQSHTTVVTYDTSASVSIRKTGQDLVMTCF